MARRLSIGQVRGPMPMARICVPSFFTALAEATASSMPAATTCAPPETSGARTPVGTPDRRVAVGEHEHDVEARRALRHLEEARVPVGAVAAGAGIGGQAVDVAHHRRVAGRDLRQRQVGRRARCRARTVPNENIAICDGVPVRSVTNVRAAFFIEVISVVLIDDETSKTIATFNPHAGGSCGLFSPLANARASVPPALSGWSGGNGVASDCSGC